MSENNPISIGELRGFLKNRLDHLERQLIHFTRDGELKETIPWREDDYYHNGKVQGIRSEIKNIKELAHKFLIVF